ncbi:MAG TPA: oligopeptide/dipeptide ABC transporter ATP-binding protein, partial [Anaerolineales bacterium]
IPGNVPDLAELPEGCAFAPRCAHVQPACQAGPIPMVSIEADRLSRCLLHIDYHREDAWKWDHTVNSP